MLIHKTIERSFSNNFHNLYDIVKISMSGVPINSRLCINTWACFIKTIEVDVKVFPKDCESINFDKFEFSISDRYHEMEHGKHNHINVDETTWAFQLIPYDYLEEWRVYLFGLEKRRVEFRVDMRIIFNDTENIFLKNRKEELDFSNLEVEVEIFSLEKFDEIFNNTHNFLKKELFLLTKKVEKDFLLLEN